MKTSPDDDICPHIQPLRVLNGRMHEVRQYLLDHDIPVGVHYKPNHLLSYFKSQAPLPVTEQLYSELMTLPLHPALSADDVTLVCTTIREALDKA